MKIFTILTIFINAITYSNEISNLKFEHYLSVSKSADSSNIEFFYDKNGNIIRARETEGDHVKSITIFNDKQVRLNIQAIENFYRIELFKEGKAICSTKHIFPTIVFKSNCTRALLPYIEYNKNGTINIEIDTSYSYKKYNYNPKTIEIIKSDYYELRDSMGDLSAICIKNECRNYLGLTSKFDSSLYWIVSNGWYDSTDIGSNKYLFYTSNHPFTAGEYDYTNTLKEYYYDKSGQVRAKVDYKGDTTSWLFYEGDKITSKIIDIYKKSKLIKSIHYNLINNNEVLDFTKEIDQFGDCKITSQNNKIQYLGVINNNVKCK